MCRRRVVGVGNRIQIGPLFEDTENAPEVLRTAAYEELLLAIGENDRRGVVLVGPAGSGKTTLLQLAETDLLAQGRAAFFIRLRSISEESDLAALLVRTVLDSPLVEGSSESRVIRSSAGSLSVAEAADLLRGAATSLGSPVLLLDGLDEAPFPSQIESLLDGLERRLPTWTLVVSSRFPDAMRLARRRGSRLIELAPFTEDESRRLLSALVPDLQQDHLNQATELAAGSPLFLRLLANQLRVSPGVPQLEVASLPEYLGRAFASVVDNSSDPSRMARLLERLAIAAEGESLGSLAGALKISAAETRALLSEGDVFLTWPDRGTVAIAHSAIREFILADRLLSTPFSLSDLQFGTEEAESDPLLDATYIQRPGFQEVFEDTRTIVIGDRGAGKSAIFRRLSAAGSSERDRTSYVLPIADPHPALFRIKVAGEEPATVSEYRAAWLLILACTLASDIPPDAPKQLDRLARDLRSAFGSPQRTSVGLKLMRALIRPFIGTSLTFAVGPINLKVTAPEGAPKKTRQFDVDDFLKKYDDFCVNSGKRMFVPIDRVDEAFKYERQKQERLVQGLLQAESSVSSQLQRIRVIVFLRTDLFELYDIQEKTKLVSRTLVLKWSEEDWLRLLVNRAFANSEVDRVKRALGAADDAQITDIAGALDALFPEQVEDQPLERWLIDSVKYGNGGISPRLVVLLLLLARDLSEERQSRVSNLPMFSGQAMADAMTRAIVKCCG